MTSYAPMTSLSHPLRIDEISISSITGKIGLTLCMGKKSYSSYSDRLWDRDLGTDLLVVKEWNAVVVVTLIEDHEFDLLHVRDLPILVQRLGMEWIHLPIVDLSVPDYRFNSLWPDALQRLIPVLRSGGNVLVHCRGGLGRAGTVAALLLIEMGMDPYDAVTTVRTARYGSIEVDVQEAYVMDYINSSLCTSGSRHQCIRQ